MGLLEKLKAAVTRRDDPAARAAKVEKAQRRAQAEAVRLEHKRRTGGDLGGGG